MKNKILLTLNFLLGLLFIFPLFKESISTLFLILVCLSTIIYLKCFKIKFTFGLKHIVYIIPFIIILITNSFLESSFFDFKNISKSLMFLVFPVVFINLPNSLFKNLETNYLYLFKYSCLIICLFYIITFLMNHSIDDFFAESYNESVFRRYIYNDVSIFKIHPTYFSLFLNLGIVHSILNTKNQRKYLNIFFIILFTIMIFLLTSRLMIVFSILSIIFVVAYKVKFKLKKVFVVLIVTLFSCGIYILPGIKSRFIEIYNDFKNPPKGMYYNSSNIRKSIYECSLSILKENYVKGVGFSNIQKELNNCYKSNYDSSFYENHDYMTHNYFIYIFIGSGVFGFVFFMFYILFLLKKCFQIIKIIIN